MLFDISENFKEQATLNVREQLLQLKSNVDRVNA